MQRKPYHYDLNMTPKVSVIVPVYNVEKYLKRCVDSLTGQTLSDIEIILVDDGSPDGCPALCDAFAAEDARIKVVHKQNEGQGFARNTGLGIATGEYVAFVDSDDYILPETYETLIKTAESQDFDVVYNGYVYQYADGTKEEKCITDCKFIGKEEVKKYISEFLKLDKMTISTCMGIYRRQIIENNGILFLSERKYVSEDSIFNIHFLTKCERVATIPFAFYQYCYNGSSFSQSFKKEKIAGVLTLYNTITDALKSGGFGDIVCFAKRYLLETVVGIMKMYMMLQIPLSEKKELSQEIFAYPVWNSVLEAIKSQNDVKPQKRILLFLIRHKMFYSSYMFFTLYYKLIKR